MASKKKTKQEVEETKDTAVSEEQQENEQQTEEKKEADPVKEAEEKIAGLTDRLMRTAAEFDNYKKRTAREKDEFYKMAVCETVNYFLPVLDNLERAVLAAENTENADEKLLEGVKMVKKQFEDVLSDIGVTPIEAVGTAFDPEKHNAVMMEENADAEENTVTAELMKGYLYKDKVIRHAMVKVAN